MDDAGSITHIFLSKIFGASRDQFATFDPEKTLVGLIPNLVWPTFVDNKFIKILDCIDMYNPVNSLATIAKNKTGKGLKSAILPVNYPSPNKTYYQVPAWDGARLGGWVEIASKIPSIIKTLYNKAFKLRYHIEIPETYFQKIYPETWEGMTEVKQAEARKKLLKEIDDFLSGDKNAYKTFISFFEVDKINKAEYGRIKITPIENLANIDSDLITSPAADMQIQIAMGVNPAETGSGKIGTGQQRSGGSDIRESSLVGTSLLDLERNVLLDPLYLVRDYNREVGGMSEWAEDLEFRVRDTVLTTLDTGAGTKKVVS